VLHVSRRRNTHLRLIAFGVALHRVGPRIRCRGSDIPIAMIAKPRLPRISPDRPAAAMPGRLEGLQPGSVVSTGSVRLPSLTARASREITGRCRAVHLTGDRISAVVRAPYARHIQLIDLSFSAQCPSYVQLTGFDCRSARRRALHRRVHHVSGRQGQHARTGHPDRVRPARGLQSGHDLVVPEPGVRAQQLRPGRARPGNAWDQFFDEPQRIPKRLRCYPSSSRLRRGASRSRS
jgi:hypothetical protein